MAKNEVKTKQANVCDVKLTPEELLRQDLGVLASEATLMPEVLGINPQQVYSFESKLEPLGPNTVRYTIIGKLLASIRRCHRRCVMIEGKKPSSQLNYMDFYRDRCIHPTLEVFNQIKEPHLEPIQYTEEVVIKDALTKFTFWEASGKYFLPILLVLAPGSLDTRIWRSKSIGSSSPYDVTSAILSLLESLPPDNKSIALLTDLDKSVIIQTAPHQSDGTRLLRCEVIEQPNPEGRTHRLIFAACINMRLPPGYLDNNCQRITAPRGALNNPDLPHPSDEEVFTSKKHFSDFDAYSLTNHDSLAEQFIRWKQHVHKEALARQCVPGDMISALTNEFNKHSIPLQNRHPLQPLPPDTVIHLDHFRRPFSSRFAQTLHLSQKFEVRLTKTLKQAEEGSRLTAVYACELVSIDGQRIEDGLSPELCLKIFDDRLFSPQDDENPMYRWFRDWTTSEDMVRREEAVYMRLEHAQGSVIPKYYGSHLFTLPDGYSAFGILMEYVHGCDLQSGVLRDLSDDAQIAFIKSTRHALRVLEYGDISQLDWDSSQIICSPAPATSQAPPGSRCCVFVDFTYALQSDTAFDCDFHDDHGNVVEILRQSLVGLRKGLLKCHWDGREKWSYYRTHPSDELYVGPSE